MISGRGTTNGSTAFMNQTKNAYYNTVNQSGNTTLYNALLSADKINSQLIPLTTKGVSIYDTYNTDMAKLNQMMASATNDSDRRLIQMKMDELNAQMAHMCTSTATLQEQTWEDTLASAWNAYEDWVDTPRREAAADMAYSTIENLAKSGVDVSYDQYEVLYQANYEALGIQYVSGVNVTKLPKIVTGTNTVTNDILEVERVGSALKADSYHSFADIIDNYAGVATKTNIDNGILYQIEGSYNGVAGRFEWIIQDNTVTHRLFVPGGTMNGSPIVK